MRSLPSRRVTPPIHIPQPFPQVSDPSSLESSIGLRAHLDSLPHSRHSNNALQVQGRTHLRYIPSLRPPPSPSPKPCLGPRHHACESSHSQLTHTPSPSPSRHSQRSARQRQSGSVRSTPTESPYVHVPPLLAPGPGEARPWWERVAYRAEVDESLHRGADASLGWAGHL